MRSLRPQSAMLNTVPPSSFLLHFKFRTNDRPLSISVLYRVYSSLDSLSITLPRQFKTRHAHVTQFRVVKCIHRPDGMRQPRGHCARALADRASGRDAAVDRVKARFSSRPRSREIASRRSSTQGVLRGSWGADDAQLRCLRSVLARALGKDVRVKFVGSGTAHLDMYSGGGAGERASTCVLNMGVGVD